LSDSGKQFEAKFSNSVASGVSTTAATLTVQQAAIASYSVSWGTSGSAALELAGDGLRLLPAGRTTDLSWLNINKIAITLDQATTLSESDLSVTGIAVANYGPVSISGSGTTYAITLHQPIATADRVTVTIGNATIATTVRRLDVLPGDFNDDGVVTMQDAILVRNEYLGIAGAVPTLIGDVNGDGKVDVNDYNAVRKNIGLTLPPLPRV
jgi:Dockerin type I domain